MLYTDGTSEANKSQVTAELAALQFAEIQPDAEATRDELQAFIDADEKLSATTIVASTDARDVMWVVVTLPTDAGSPLFWAAQAEQIVSGKGQFVEQRTDVMDEDGNPTGEQTGEWKIRMSKVRWRTELARISTLL